MNKLTVATNNAKEAIGKGLFDALASTGGGGSGGFEMFTKGVDLAAQSVALLLRVMGKTSGAINLFAQGKFGSAADLILGKQPLQRSGLTPSIASELKKAAAEKAAAKNRAAIAKATQSQTKAIKEQTALQKANSLFEMDQIQLVAALKGKLSDEDRTRAELQLAILQGNTDQASKLAGKVAEAQGLSKDLVAYYSGLPNAKNPFLGWIDTLKEAAILAQQIANGNYGVTAPNYNGAAIDTILSGYGSMPSPAAAGVSATGDVNVYVAGSVVSEGDLVELVRDGLLNKSLSGSPSAIGRLKGSFAG